jgi:integrase/recombinase XerD
VHLGKLAESFLGANRNSFSANTLRAYRYDLNSLAKAFPETCVSEVGVEHLRAFLGATADLAPSTLARRQAALRSCFGWAYREGLIASDPAARLEKVKVPRRDPRPLTAEQAEALLAAMPAAHRRNRLLFTMLYETGMRVGEALGVHIGHVHVNAVDGGYIRVVGKGDEERIVPLIDASRTVRLLRSHLKGIAKVGPLFGGDPRKGGRPAEAMDYTTVLHHFERYLARARRRRPDLFESETEPITIHRLRHSYATAKLQEGVSLQAVRKLMGHKNLQTTLRYAETDMESIKQELVEARRRSGRGSRAKRG